ncbi:MAG: TauD/TfdA family dioxygenase, partial [Steroidobacteraceae bacterium]
MTITVSRLTPALGAIVEGVNLADELTQESVDRLGELLVEHQILFFRGQPITPQQQCRFAARF